MRPVKLRFRKLLPLWFLLPAGIAVTLFFLVPVILTFLFSFTTMSSDTGILGRRYVVTEESLRKLRESDFDPVLIEKLGRKDFVFDPAGLKTLKTADLRAKTIKEIEEKFADRTYFHEKKLLADLKHLDNRISFVQRKTVTKSVVRTIINRPFPTAEQLREGLAGIGLNLDDRQFRRLLNATYTGWTWTVDNYRQLLSSRFTGRIALNTLIYVFFTLLFNIGFALVLSLLTFYMPAGPSKCFRAIWLLPRASPSVIYVMLWKWLTYDSGLLSYVLGAFDIQGKNWLMEFPWTFIILINGFVGASMGLIIFSSAMAAIPKSLLYAAEVDGAYPAQQVLRLILPLMRWPILFVTCYQSMSLLTSFEYIQLTTDGGPGFYTTEVWALHAFHIALSNYFGNLRYGYGAALAVVLVAAGILLSLIYLRLANFRKLMTEPPIDNY